MRLSFDAMGTTVSVEWDSLTISASRAPELISSLAHEFEKLERDFSLYRPESELSQIANGEVELVDSSLEIRSVYSDALLWRTATQGAFTPHRPDGVIDLNGIVKALAIARAGAVLDAEGADSWMVNAGGDVLCSSGCSDASVGIVDPRARDQLLCAVTVRAPRRAIATSGGSERGDHIWKRFHPEAATFAQATVIANDIIAADVLATAIVSGGPVTLDAVTGHWDVDVLTVDDGGELRATPGFRDAIVDDNRTTVREHARRG